MAFSNAILHQINKHDYPRFNGDVNHAKFTGYYATGIAQLADYSPSGASNRSVLRKKAKIAEYMDSLPDMKTHYRHYDQLNNSFKASSKAMSDRADAKIPTLNNRFRSSAPANSRYLSGPVLNFSQSRPFHETSSSTLTNQQ